MLLKTPRSRNLQNPDKLTQQREQLKLYNPQTAYQQEARSSILSKPVIKSEADRTLTKQSLLKNDKNSSVLITLRHHRSPIHSSIQIASTEIQDKKAFIEKSSLALAIKRNTMIQQQQQLQRKAALQQQSSRQIQLNRQHNQHQLLSYQHHQNQHYYQMQRNMVSSPELKKRQEGFKEIQYKALINNKKSRDSSTIKIRGYGSEEPQQFGRQSGKSHRVQNETFQANIYSDNFHSEDQVQTNVNNTSHHTIDLIDRTTIIKDKSQIRQSETTLTESKNQVDEESDYIENIHSKKNDEYFRNRSKTQRRPVVKVDMDLKSNQLLLVKAVPKKKKSKNSVDRSILRRSLSQSAKSLISKANQIKEEATYFSPKPEKKRHVTTLWKVIDLKI